MARSGKRRLPLGKRIVFNVLTLVLFFVAVEVLLALFGVRPVVVEEDPYVGFSSKLPLYVPEGGGRLRTASNKLSLFNDQSFPREKPRGTFRIFTLGGSCTYGRPFDDRTSFSGWLRTYLGAVAPDTDWEVVNAGGISYASYRVATLMEELAGYEPDLFVIYSGHNEFLERRTYSGLIEEPEALTETKLLLQKSRLWALGQGIAERRREAARERYEMTGEVEELLDSSVGLDYYFRDDAFKRQVLDHYRYNLGRMLNIARSAGARAIIATVPVNEKDFSPFKSQHKDGLSEADRARHAELLAASAEALDKGEWDLARERAEEAVALDALHAEGHFLLGEALQALGRYDDAGRSYARAIAEDVCPLRALEETNRIILATAEAGTVPLVDYRRLLKGRMRELAGHENLGDELFLDHAHPTVEANGIFARALVEEMAAMGILELSPGWHEAVGERVASQVLGRIDAQTQAQAYKNLSKLLIWTGKKRDAEKYVKLATDVLGDDWELHYNEGLVRAEAGDWEAAVKSFEEAVRLDPRRAAARDQLAVAWASLGDLEKAVAEGRKAVELEPGSASYWNNLATFLNAQGDNDAALEATRAALKADPDFAEAVNTQGKVYFDRGDLEQALKRYERAASLRPNYLEAMTNRGLVLGQMGRFAEAERAFAAVLAEDPAMAPALLGQGRSLYALGRQEEAARAFEKAIGSGAGDAEAFELLATILAATGRPERAWEVLKEGLASHPKAARLYRLHGRFLAQESYFDDAERAFSEAIALDPDYLQARVDLGNLAMVRGRHGEAIQIYKEAVERHGDDDRLHHILATALLIAGRYEEGRVHLEKALELNPSNEAAARDLEKLRARGL